MLATPSRIASRVVAKARGALPGWGGTPLVRLGASAVIQVSIRLMMGWRKSGNWRVKAASRKSRRWRAA